MAAGLGFKDFTTGEVLTAADVDGYLMQGIWVFDDAAARDAAVTSPQEGNFAFLKDTNVTTYYTGSAWANVDTTGMTNPMTTTGDVIYSSSGSTPARLGIGTAGQVLQVNSGATAPEWGTPATGGGGLVFISRSSFSAVASVSANNVFTSTYDNYVLKIQITGISANDANFFVKTRSAGTDRSTNYNVGVAAVDRSGNSASFAALDSTDGYKLGEFDGGETAQNYAFEVDFMYPTSNTRQQIFIKTCFISQSNVFTMGAGGGMRTTTGAADGFTLRSSAGNFTGTCDIYGLAKA